MHDTIVMAGLTTVTQKNIKGPSMKTRIMYVWAGAKIQIDEDVREEYWLEIRKQPENKEKKIV